MQPAAEHGVQVETVAAAHADHHAPAANNEHEEKRRPHGGVAPHQLGEEAFRAFLVQLGEKEQYHVAKHQQSEHRQHRAKPTWIE